MNQRMRGRNDCAIAAIAFATGFSYPRVLKAAIDSQGFRLGGPMGCNMYQTLNRLRVPYECEIYRRRHSMNVRKIRLQGVRIVSVRSLNLRRRNAYHAVVLIDGKVFDPSNRRRASLDYVLARADNAAVIWPLTYDDRW